jgi:urease accessory protein
MGKGGLTAFAAVTTCRDAAGRSRVTRLRSDGPLALRESAGAVYLVGAAAGPLGGDALALELRVGDGSTLTVRQSAATLVLPGAAGAWSRLRVHAHVGAGASLRFVPEPTIVAAGCRHVLETRLEVATGGSVWWEERLVLGRANESPDEVVSRIDVERAGRPLLRHALHLGAATSSSTSAVIGSAKAVGSVVSIGPAAAPSTIDSPAGTLGRYVLAPDACLVTATAPDAAALDRLLLREREIAASLMEQRSGIVTDREVLQGRADLDRPA